MSYYINPRLKPIVEFCSLDKKIYFFHRPGIAIQLDDPANFIATVCKLMDGIKSLHELTQELLLLFPKETPYLESLLTVLDKEYLLEDTAVNCPENLTEYDITRWSRNIEFFGSHCKATENKYSYQEKLKSVRVVILGLGGVGSNVLYNLAAMGVSNIKAVDFDAIELSNLNRQIIYRESDIGKLKSDISMQRIAQFLPQANVKFINKKIICTEDVAEIIFGQDIVIAAIDHPREKIMNWINEACVKEKIPFLCGSLDSKVVTYYSIFPGKTGCVECWKMNSNNHVFIFQDLIQHENFISSRATNVAVMPFISLVTGFLTSEFLKIMTNISEPQSLGKLCTYDVISSQMMISENWEKNPNCSVCSTN